MAITYNQGFSRELTSIDLTYLIDVVLLESCLDINKGSVIKYIHSYHNPNVATYSLCICDDFGYFDKYKIINAQFFIQSSHNFVPLEWYLSMSECIDGEVKDLRGVDVSINAPTKFLEEISSVIDKDTIKETSIENLNQMIDMFYDVFSSNDRIKIEYYKVMIKHIKENLTSLL